MEKAKKWDANLDAQVVVMERVMEDAKARAAMCALMAVPNLAILDVCRVAQVDVTILAWVDVVGWVDFEL